MSMLRKNQGFSTIAMLFYFMVGILAVTSVLKLGPVYLENWTVRQFLNTIASEPEALAKGESGVLEAIRKHKGVNENYTLKDEDIAIETTDTDIVVNINYEVRIPFFYNIDVILKFDNVKEYPLAAAK